MRTPNLQSPGALAIAPTQPATPYPTYTLYPTYTPYPTFIPAPTALPIEPAEAPTIAILGILQRIEVIVTRVIDGDTIEVESSDGDTVEIHLLSVDTPEIHQPNQPDEFSEISNTACLDAWGLRAAQFSLSQLEGQTITLIPGPDTAGGRTFGDLFFFGRLFAYVDLNGADFNALLVELGFASVKAGAPNTRVEHYSELQQAAQEKSAGLWACRQVGDVAATSESPTPAPGTQATPTPTPVALPLQTPTPTTAPTPSPTPTIIPPPTPTALPAPTATPTPEPTLTPTPTPTPTLIPSPTPTPQPEATPVLQSVEAEIENFTHQT